MPELMEVLEFLDNTGSIMVKRVPDVGETEIKWGAQLTVRESQTAIFFRDGRALDTFGPGRHVLKTQNIPLITKAVTGLGYGTDSPFRAEAYFLSMKLFSNLKWGTKEPILFRDKDLQMIRLRSFGIFSIQIDDPSLFLNKVVGTSGLYTDIEIEDYLKNLIITRVTDMIGENISSIFDIPKDINELSVIGRESIADEFKGLGLKIHDFAINSISPPKEVQEMIDARTGMAAVGDMDKFFKYKAAMSMEAAAENPGGGASDGLGMGAGLGMGFMLPNMLANSGGFGSGGATTAPSPMDKLKKLKELYDLGALTQSEYDEKKSKLLEDI
jgi:membrane protease subunit (stomatin/prohibitin family)|tara:strand:+ start:2213 stop:3196 length:984 start_codon:yes stop_codon:yes gene_type:complete